MKIFDVLREKKHRDKIHRVGWTTSTLKTEKRKQRVFANLLFIVLCVVILIFLLNAPKETTVKLPNDMQHIRFHAMKNKKEAEKFCGECHSPNGKAPLSEKHPPKFRCLFCHKTR